MYRYYGIYRNGLIFRKAPSSGEEEGGGLLYGLDAREGAAIRFYDASTDDYLGEIRSDAGDLFLGCQFELTPRGPGSASLTLAGLPTFVQVGVRMDIHLYPWGEAWYSGRIAGYEIPSGDVVTVSAASLLDDLKRRIWTETYASQTIEAIVTDIITTLEADISLVYDADLIGETGYTAGQGADVKFDHQKVYSILEKMEELSQTFVFGYRASDRKFYFTDDRFSTLLHLWEGAGCGAVDIKVDASDLANRIFVRLGEADGVTGSLYSSTPVEDVNSQGEYGIRETAISAGDLGEDDALEYARFYLNDNKDPKVSAVIESVLLWHWMNVSPSALGYVRVTKGNIDDPLVPQPLVAEWLLDDGMSDYTMNWTGSGATSSDGATYMTGAGSDSYVKIASVAEFPFSLKVTAKVAMTSGYAEIRIGNGSKKFVLEIYGDRIEPEAGSDSYAVSMTSYQTLMICCHDGNSAAVYHLVNGIWINTGIALASEVSANDELWMGIAAANAGILYIDQASYIAQDLSTQIQIQPEGISTGPVYSLPIEKIAVTVSGTNILAKIEAGTKQVTLGSQILDILRRMEDSDIVLDSVSSS